VEDCDELLARVHADVVSELQPAAFPPLPSAPEMTALRVEPKAITRGEPSVSDSRDA
jgi:hypothetical protein